MSIIHSSVGAFVAQQLHNLGVALAEGQYQRRVSEFFLGVHVGALLMYKTG